MAVTALAIIVAIVRYMDRAGDDNPVYRISDYEKMIFDILSKYKGSIYIVLEDIDRAGDQGRLFLETVSSFFHQEYLSKKKINIIVPMQQGGETKVKAEGDSSFYDSCQKSIDNFIYFKPIVKSVEPLLKEVLNSEYSKPEDIKLMNEIIQPHMNNRSINLRQLKRILRDSVKRHERIISIKGESIFSLCVIAETLKYIPGPGGTSSGYHYNNAYNNGMSGAFVTSFLEWAVEKHMIKLPGEENKSGIEVQLTRVGVTEEESESNQNTQISYTDTATNRNQRGTSNRIKRRTYSIDPIYFTDL